MRHTIKATIKTPPKWGGMNSSEREIYLVAQLRELANKVERGHDTRKTIQDRNGNTVAVEVRA